MPRYHFHMKSKCNRIVDDKGQNLNSSWEAYLRAQEIVRKCLDYLGQEDDNERWLIKICNDAGEAELFVLFPRPAQPSAINHSSCR
jgi:hypothetical protein